VRGKKLIVVSGWSFVFFVALYFLTAPFMVDVLWTKRWEPNLKNGAYTTTVSWKFYAPARSAIASDWFGRNLYDGYCYQVCRMKLLLPMEFSHGEN
jgi:hypothetical protein